MRATLLSILLLAMAQPMPLAAEETSTGPSSGLVQFSPTSTYRVEVDGAEIRTAEMFMGDPGLLLLGCSLRFPVLVCPTDQTIRYIPQENVIRDSEGNINMKGTPTDPISSYQTNGGQLIFSAEGRKVKLIPRPPLTGPQTLDKIIEHSPDYGTRIKYYTPNQPAVEYLAKYSRKTEVQIFFGSWCSHCEAWVPRLVKSLQAANNPGLEMQFEALPKNFSVDAAAKAKGVTGVPTIILIQDGREVGRLNAPQEGTFEEALVKVLQTAAP
jgi:thiol-disulfide isomerase/thioredoxin